MSYLLQYGMLPTTTCMSILGLCVCMYDDIHLLCSELSLHSSATAISSRGVSSLLPEKYGTLKGRTFGTPCSLNVPVVRSCSSLPRSLDRRNCAEGSFLLRPGSSAYPVCPCVHRQQKLHTHRMESKIKHGMFSTSSAVRGESCHNCHMLVVSRRLIFVCYGFT